MLVRDALPDLKDSLEMLDLDVGGLVANGFSLESAIVNIANANAEEWSHEQYELRRVSRYGQH